MSKKDDGGLAFPIEYKFGDGTATRHDGMSLRDYFAARCMHASIMKMNFLGGFFDEGGCTYLMTAQQAYALADAMLEARKQ